MLAVGTFVDILTVVADLHEARFAVADVRAKGIVALSRIADVFLAAFVDIETVLAIAAESGVASARIRTD